jgi:hypothetical protein
MLVKIQAVSSSKSNQVQVKSTATRFAVAAGFLAGSENLILLRFQHS